MDNDATPKEARILGDELGGVLVHVRNDLVSLRARWGVYKSLFGTNTQRINLLSSASEIVSFYFERSLFESTISAICRVTDPPVARENRNVSLHRLKSAFEGCDGLDDFNELCFEANEKSRFARRWRDKIFAHSDDKVRNRKVELDLVSIDKVDECIDAIARALKFVYSRRFDVHFETRPVIDYSADDVKFLKVIFDGIAEAAARKERCRQLAKQGRYDDAEKELEYPFWLTERPCQNWDVD